MTINLTAYQDDGDFGKKFIAEQRAWIAEFETNPNDEQHNCDAGDFSRLLGEALTEIERLNSQLAERDALAKGDEMTCIHDWDYSPDNADTLFTCLKCGTELYAVDSFNRLNMLEHYVAQFRKEGDEYRAQLAARDALIERLVEAGTLIIRTSLFERVDINNLDRWDYIVAKYRAMKKESVE